MQNITLNAEAHLIEKAREKASRQRTSLNKMFREWLAGYVNEDLNLEYDQLKKPLDKVDLGGSSLSREERNAR